jgi:hypothetical protein
VRNRSYCKVRLPILPSGYLQHLQHYDVPLGSLAISLLEHAGVLGQDPPSSFDRDNMADGDNTTPEAMPEDVADTGVAAESTLEGSSAATSSNLSSVRPGLQRNQLPPPPNQPGQAAPMAPAPQPAENNNTNTANNNNQVPPDSLSLAQLRRMVSEFPRTEAIAYDFDYSDTGPHGEEIDEWFVYQFWQWVRLNAAQRAFEGAWEAQHDPELWEDVDERVRARFVRDSVKEIAASSGKTRAAAVAKVVYVVAGRWEDTAGASPLGDKSKMRTVAAPAHLAAIREGVDLVAQIGGLPIIWATFQTVLDDLW